MYQSALEALRREISGLKALANVARIVEHHRIQASPGYRAAAEWCERALAASGIKTKIHSYPYDGERTYWASRSFEEWEGLSGQLTLVEPQSQARRLADFSELKISLIQRSAPTPPGGVEAELVVLADPEDEASYANLDLKGKLVLVRGDLDRIRDLAVKKAGALGIVSDGMSEFPPVRERTDVPDARQYTSFWWPNPHEPKCFGFVLSPRQGEWLRALIKQETAASRPVIVRANVESRFYPGAIEDVEACIPGTAEGEILVVAHLCHPQASANDNASGCGAAMEAARAIADLIASGGLERPRRSIRFLLVPEMAGTYAFLASNEHLIPDIKAAINLDMVGENQEVCGSSFLVEKPPRSIASFAGDLAGLILGSIAADAGNLGGTSRYALFRHAVTPFSGGSDHWILSDPTVGIPCPMLIQWPDKFYHTSQDTIDKVDPAMLSRAALLTATYAYSLAAAGDREVAWLAGEIAAGFAAECAAAGRSLSKTGDATALGSKLAFLRDRKMADIQSAAALGDGSAPDLLQAALASANSRVAAEYGASLAHYTGLLGASVGTPPAGTSGAAAASDSLERIPERAFRGPLGRREMFAGLTPTEREEWSKNALAVLKDRGKDLWALSSLVSSALCWTDGRRNVGEISHMVAMETGWCDPDILTMVFEVLQRQGYVRWIA